MIIEVAKDGGHSTDFRENWTTIKGKEVGVGNNDFLKLGQTDRKRTNQQGEVEFSIEPWANGTIYVDGNRAYQGKIDGFMRISV